MVKEGFFFLSFLLDVNNKRVFPVVAGSCLATMMETSLMSKFTQRTRSRALPRQS